MVYSVDEVSERLDIPRPTLYRYLREYSIPHVRRAGKISIPEESFERIREARELHREGLGTESVRRKLQEGSDLDVEELAERLDRLSLALESLQEDLKPTGGVASTQGEALQTLHKKQDTLISEVSRLAVMVEDLSKTERRIESEASRREASDGLERTRDPETLSEKPEEPSEERFEGARNAEGDPARGHTARVAEDEPDDGIAAADEDPDPTTRMNGHLPSTGSYSGSGESFAIFPRHERFGALTRRRRRGALAILLALLVVLLLLFFLVWGLLAPSEETQEQPSPDEQEAQEDPRSEPADGESSQAVRIPGLIGLALPEAEDEIGEAGLKVGAVDEISSYAVPADTVAAQEPAVGVEVDPGTSLNLVVSSGPPEA